MAFILADPSHQPATDGQASWQPSFGRSRGHEEDDDDFGIADLFGGMEFSNSAVRPAEEEEEEQQPGQIDIFARLNNAVERRVELVPLNPPVQGRNTTVFGRRLTSAFSNIWSKSKSRFLTRRAHECIICTAPIDGKFIRLPCGHHYDGGCIAALFEAASRDESLFPPRCCKRPIPFQSVREHIPVSIKDNFLEKSREFNTAKRVYCVRPQCSRFLGAQEVGKGSHLKAYACVCGTTTCAQCQQAHEDGIQHSCTKMIDEGTEVLLALGKKQGWARCPGCRTMIELNLGCYHMTCLCKVEFCYLCEARWKTCRCTQWDETRLVAAAQERIDVQLENMEAQRRVAPVLRRWNRHPEAMIARPRHVLRHINHEELLQAVVEDLRVNHDCQHTQWRYRDGGGRCVGCYDYLDRYVFHCVGCDTIACNRCRLNRF